MANDPSFDSTLARQRAYVATPNSSPLFQVERELGKLDRFDEGDAVLGQEIVQHAGVLHADEGAEDAEHPGRHAEVEADTVGVPGARAETVTAFEELLDRALAQTGPFLIEAVI